MNVSDSQRIAIILESWGFKPASEKQADLIIVNACSVRQSAVDRIYGKLRHWGGKKVFITGCLLPHDKEKLSKKVDLIFDIKDLPKLPQHLSQIFGNYFKIPSQSIHPFIQSSIHQNEAYVPIMTGCDHFCSYCAVPYTRGREASKPEKEIICEVKNLVKRGVKEIILLGQNVNRFRPNFVGLLKKIVEIPGDFKIKFISANPWDFPDELVKLIAKEPKLSKEIHLPVQSGDDEILRKMNRPYTKKEYLKLIHDLRFKIYDLRLSTDIIVGFPGETKKAFENTVSLCQEAKFAKAYIAQYSPRPGTYAAKIKDNVSKKEKKSRWKTLESLINQRQKNPPNQ